MIDRKLGRKKEHRERTMRNLATSLVLYEKIRTTEAKAKSLSPVVERIISIARKGTVTARRQCKAILFDQNAVSKLFEDLPARQGDRESGFVRITKLPPRAGDGASMALMELNFIPLEKILETDNKTKVSVRKRPAKVEENKAEEVSEKQA